MTPRERAQQFVDTQALLSLGEMQRVNVIEALLLADREALQSEIVKRLQMERAEASPNAYLALNAAIGIVQAVFDQPAKPEGSKPEADMVHFAVVPFQAYCGADKRGQCTAALLASVTCKACAEVVDEWYQRSIDDNHQCWYLKNAAEDIRARSEQVSETIQQLNESNNKLSEENYALREKVRRLESLQSISALAAIERDKQTIARLEKENHELTQKLQSIKEKIEELNPPDDDDRYSYSRILARS